MSDRITDALWCLSLDGSHDKETGETDTTGWFALFRGGMADLRVEDGEGLTQDDFETLRRAAGAILSVDSHGSRSSTLYATTEALEEAWSEIEADCMPEDDDDSPAPEGWGDI